MSLYHEAAAVLAAEGGSLKSRVFGNKDLKSPPAQVYALALESSKWSPVLKEVIENAQLLHHERKLDQLTATLSLLLVHDLLLAKNGIALPSSHGLRAAVERHRARLTSEFTRARVRRKQPSLDALRASLEESASPSAGLGGHPRWVRINTLKTSLPAQLETTFAQFEEVGSVEDVLRTKGRVLYVDEHVPNLVAIPPGSIDITKTDAYRSGAVILQDKASCFPAHLLNPGPGDGDVIDSCAAPGNKTTHLAAILKQAPGKSGTTQRIHAFEKDEHRARTLDKMVRIAGSDGFTVLNKGRDFLKADPESEIYRNVRALLLDPSCSGSGIVGRDDGAMLGLHLPDPPGGGGATRAAGGKKQMMKNKKKAGSSEGRQGDRKRKREDADDQRHIKDETERDGEEQENRRTFVDDDGQTTTAASGADLRARLRSLSAFQCSLLQHALSFPAAKKVTYSTCSVHAEENEHVVLRALGSEVARRRGWRVMTRAEQVEGMRAWPVRGRAEFCRLDDGDEEEEAVAEACIRAYKGDGRGVMGFFVAGLVRDGDEEEEAELWGASRAPAGGRAERIGDNLAAARSPGEQGGSGESDWDGFED